MIKKYGKVVANFTMIIVSMFKLIHQRLKKTIMVIRKEVYDDVHIKFGDMDKDFLTSYYRDEMKAKGIDADYDVRLGDNYEKRNPTYYNSESAVNKFLGFGSRNDVSKSQMYPKDEWDNDFKLWVIGTSYCHQRKFVADQETFKLVSKF